MPHLFMCVILILYGFIGLCAGAQEKTLGEIRRELMGKAVVIGGTKATGIGASLNREVLLNWGSRRYQGKIYGKEDSDEIAVSRQTRLHPKKQVVVLYVTSHPEREVTVLDSKTGRVTPVYRPS